VVSKERPVTNNSVLPSWPSSSTAAAFPIVFAGASTSSPELEDESFFLAETLEFFLEVFLTGSLSLSDPEPDDEAAFLACFPFFLADPAEAAEAFLTAFFGASLSEELSSSEEDSFLAAFLDEEAFFATTLTDSSEDESSSEEDSATFFFYGTAYFSTVLLTLFLPEPLDALEAALALLAAGFFSVDELLSLSEEEDSCFLDFFETF
jgi:hypothetical protein